MSEIKAILTRGGETLAEHEGDSSLIVVLSEDGCYSSVGGSVDREILSSLLALTICTVCDSAESKGIDLDDVIPSALNKAIMWSTFGPSNVEEHDLEARDSIRELAHSLDMEVE